MAETQQFTRAPKTEDSSAAFPTLTLYHIVKFRAFEGVGPIVVAETMARWIILFLLALLPGGCISTADINDGFRRIDLVWQTEYQRTEDEYRYRVVDADMAATLDAVRATFIDLGLRVHERDDPFAKILTAEADAPTPLSRGEWAKVAAAENPRIREIGGAMFSISEDPKNYVVTLAASVRQVNKKTFVLIDYRLSAPVYERAGIIPSRHAPPSAVQIGSIKFWRTLAHSIHGHGSSASRRALPARGLRRAIETLG